MKSLIVLQTSIVLLDKMSSGMLKRIGLFVKAISNISDSIDIINYIPENEMKSYQDINKINAEHSRFWGVNIRIFLIPTARRKENFLNHYILGIFNIRQQKTLFAYNTRPQISQVKNIIDNKYDLVFASQIGAISAVLATGVTPMRMYFDLNDIEHKLLFRSIKNVKFRFSNIFYYFHIPAIIATEYRAAALSRGLCVCSVEDAMHLQRIGFPNTVITIPNALPVPQSVTRITNDETLLFLGNYDYPPNSGAVTRILTRIWPNIQMRRPNARLIIAGNGSDRLPSAGNPPKNVEFTGFVENLQEIYDKSRVVICPLTVGGGTRIKLIEAAGYGRPMVSTRIGAEGLGFIDGIDIILEDDDDGFVEACCNLLNNYQRCVDLGQAARVTAVLRYDAAQIQQQICDIFSGRVDAQADQHNRHR